LEWKEVGKSGGDKWVTIDKVFKRLLFESLLEFWAVSLSFLMFTPRLIASDSQKARYWINEWSSPTNWVCETIKDLRFKLPLNSQSGGVVSIFMWEWKSEYFLWFRTFETVLKSCAWIITNFQRKLSESWNTSQLVNFLTSLRERAMIQISFSSSLRWRNIGTLRNLQFFF
jgi:hypothetical protein